MRISERGDRVTAVEVEDPAAVPGVQVHALAADDVDRPLCIDVGEVVGSHVHPGAGVMSPAVSS